MKDWLTQLLLLFANADKTMDRPGWNDLTCKLRRESVSKTIVWRLDRLGRTVSGLSQLFELLQERKVGLVSLRDGVDLSTSCSKRRTGVSTSFGN